MKSNSWVVVEIGGALVFLCTMSFIFTPAYEKGVWLIVGALVLAFGNALGVKSGSSIPQQAGDVKPGQATESETTTKTKSTEQPPPPETPKTMGV